MKDDLTIIKGIGAGTERKLNGAGIATFAQIASLEGETLEKLDADLNLRNADWPEWIAQAKALAAAAPSDSGADAAGEAAAQSAAPPTGAGAEPGPGASSPAASGPPAPPEPDSAPPPANAPAPAEPAKPKGGAVACLVVTHPKGRRRAGRRFGPEETRIPLADLSDAEVVAITEDPELSVEEGTMEAGPLE